MRVEVDCLGMKEDHTKPKTKVRKKDYKDKTCPSRRHRPNSEKHNAKPPAFSSSLVHCSIELQRGVCVGTRIY